MNEILTITRTENAFADASSVARLHAIKKSGVLFLEFNLAVSAGTMTSQIEIARIAGWTSPINIEANIPPQNGSNKVLLLSITYNGVITIYGNNGLDNAFYRAMFAVPSTS